MIYCFFPSVAFEIISHKQVPDYTDNLKTLAAPTKWSSSYLAHSLVGFGRNMNPVFKECEIW